MCMNLMNISIFTAQIHAKAGVLRISNKHDASYYTVTNYSKEEKTSRTSGLLILFVVGHGGGIEELERCR